MLRASAFLIALAAAPISAAAAAPFKTERVETELVSARAAVAPGETFTVALRQKIIPGWHTYWRNPGDSGAPTTIEWALPAGFSATGISWPVPQPWKYGPLVNYGYGGEVLLPVAVTAPKDAKSGPAVLKAKVNWLVCADICVPEEAELSLSITVSAAGADDPAWAGPVRAALAGLPEKSGLAASLAPQGENYVLTLSGAALKGARKLYFLPFEGDKIDHAAKQRYEVEDAVARLTLTPSVIGHIARGPLEGVLTFETQAGGAWVKRAVEISAPTSP